MRFGPLPLDALVGTVLAHSVRLPDGVLRKGLLLGPDEVTRLAAAGHTEVEVVRLEPGDLSEDAAAARVAALLAGPHLEVGPATTGRANLSAVRAGVVQVDAAGVAGLNGVDEAVTASTVPDGTAVQAGQLVATVKIIPFAVPDPVVGAVEARVAGRPLLMLHPFRPARVGLIVTTLPHEPARKATLAEVAVRARVEALGARLERVDVVAHERAAVGAVLAAQRAAGLDPVLLFGATQTSDRRDVLPEAVTFAGGRVLRVGIPADPGNLLFHGELDGGTILGVPGCARAPARSGFDPVLERVLAGLDLSPTWMAALGAGGLYKETAARGRLRRASDAERGPLRVGAILLAAGRASRMGGPNKLTVPFAGRPLVAWAADALVASPAAPVVVVTGHDADAVRTALAGRALRFAHNPRFAEGLSTSLRVGLEALADEALDGVLVALADMPLVSTGDLARLLDAFAPDEGVHVCVPVHDRTRGNPVLWGRRHFPALAGLQGDVGARGLLEAHVAELREVPVDSRSVLTDLDTPEAFARAAAALPPSEGHLHRRDE